MLSYNVICWPFIMPKLWLNDSYFNFAEATAALDSG